MNIRRATIEDFEEVNNIISSATKQLEAKGFTHWTGYYTKERIVENITTKETYVGMENQKAIGTVTITEKKNEYWSDQNNTIYMSALAVLPEYQHQGFGRELLAFTEKEAQSRQMTYIRFDAIGNWKELVDYYLMYGAKIKGTVGDPNKTFGYLYEKKI